MELNDLEHAVLEKLLAGDHPVLEALRAQLRSATIIDRKWTGVGFFTDFLVSDAAPRTPGQRKLQIGSVQAAIDGLKHGAGFVLFVEDGKMTCLEGFTYDEPWPERLGGFSVEYSKQGPRNLSYLDE